MRGQRRPLDVHLPDQADLIGVRYWPERVEPETLRPDVVRSGDAIHVTLYWRATHPVARAFQTVLQLVSPDTGQVWAQTQALTPQSVSIDTGSPGR